MTPSKWLPTLTIAALLVGWEALVRIAGIPHYTLPAPTLVAQTLCARCSACAAWFWWAP